MEYRKVFIPVIVILSFCTVLYGQNTALNKKGERINELKRNYFEGKYKEASLVYIDNSDSLSAEEYYYLGLTNNCLYNFEAAADYLQKANLLEPSNTGYEYELAKVFLQLGRTKPAGERFANILKREPEYVPVLFDAGTLDFSQKKYRDAVGKFKKVTKIAPSNFLAYYNLARSYFLLEPQTAFSDSVSVYLSVCTSINPDYLPAIEMLANWDMNHKFYDQARILYLRAADKYPEREEYLFYAGLCRENEGEYRKALVFFDEAIAKNSKDYRYWDHLGFSYYKLNSFDSAVVSYKKAVELDEENPSHYLNLAYSYVKADSSDQAVKTFEAAAVKMHPEIIAQVYSEIGTVYYGKNDFRNAAKAYRTAVLYNPKSITDLYFGAISEEQINNFKDALAGYKKALELLKNTLPKEELEKDKRYNPLKKRIAFLTKKK